MTERDFAEDKLHEECGVFGIYSKKDDVALNTYWGLFALQHRGQESAGIAVSDGRHMHIKKAMGLVNDVFKDGVRGLTAIWLLATCVIPLRVPAFPTMFSL